VAPCSVFAFRLNFYVSEQLKILTLADCFRVETEDGTSMKIHEYQAKGILSRYGVRTPRGEVAFTKEEAREAAQRLKSSISVVKAQIHAGGRGKGGGVKLARSADEAADIASHILGMMLVTPQTGPAGRLVKRVLVEEGLDIKRELYLGLLVDRASGRVVFMASAAGGMEIEEVAKENPGAILREMIHPALGLQPYQARNIAFGLGLPIEAANAATPFLQALYRAFMDTDASLLEINPCVLTGDSKLVALDAKMTFDDNGLFRQKELRGFRDLDEEDPLEVEASKHGLNYIKLDGSVACMVNGAGLAMATMDIIKYAGGSPANFLDVGGGASAEQVKNAFRILMSDPAVKAVFINIFGGILRCDVLATGVVAAAQDLQVKVPVVVRMEGTNVEKGQQILRESKLNFTIASDMKDGAQKVVALAGGAR